MEHFCFFQNDICQDFPGKGSAVFQFNTRTESVLLPYEIAPFVLSVEAPHLKLGLFKFHHASL